MVEITSFSYVLESSNQEVAPNRCHDNMLQRLNFAVTWWSRKIYFVAITVKCIVGLMEHQILCNNYTYCLDAATGKTKKKTVFKKSTGFVINMKRWEVHVYWHYECGKSYIAGINVSIWVSAHVHDPPLSQRLSQLISSGYKLGLILG